MLHCRNGNPKGSSTQIRVLVLLVFLFSSFVVNAQHHTEASFGKGIKFTPADSSFSIKFSTRFQTLYRGDYTIDSKDYSDRLLIRRARLKFDGFVADPSLTYKIELGISNRDHGGGNIAETGFTPRIILDAVVKWQATEHWSIWFGQTKLPGNRERVISSQKMQFVDRSLLNATLNLDRDIGVQFWHTNNVGKAGVLRKGLSVSMGEGRDIIASNAGGYDFTFRMDYLPFGDFKGKGDYFGADLAREPKPKLAVGFTYDRNVDAVRQRGQLGRYVRLSDGTQLTNTLSTVFIDAMLKYQGWSFMGEYGNKNGVSNEFAVLDDGGTIKYVTGSSINLQSGYLFKNNYEVALRYTSTAPDDAEFSGLVNQQMYTLGFSKYIVGHSLKLQSDISYWEIATASNRWVFEFQVEVSL